jgi:hypothetical protein
VDSTRPPQIVVEEVADCRDAAAARAEIASALAPASAPGVGWTVKARFTRDRAHLTVGAAVVDATGVRVAERVMSTDGTLCAGLAKAVGVWASLVLDTEVDRAQHAGEDVAPPAPLSVPPPPAARETNLWPDVDAAEKHSPEEDVFLHHAQGERTIEIGLQSFLMGGTGGGPVLGPALYGIFEAAHGIYLRPTLMLGHSVGSATTSAEGTFVGARLDGCARLPGYYRERRGLQLDLCAGAETGFSQLDPGVALMGSSSVLPFVAVGPSFGIRGELGNRLSATIRGITEVSLLRDEVSMVDGARAGSSLFVGRAEVGLSWAIQ